MGGHSAWRKRVADGQLAKGSGGAIMRHRPHLGRKGKDLIKNRKGHIGGGNPKKKKKNKKGAVVGVVDNNNNTSERDLEHVEKEYRWFDGVKPNHNPHVGFLILGVGILLAVVYFLFHPSSSSISDTD